MFTQSELTEDTEPQWNGIFVIYSSGFLLSNLQGNMFVPKFNFNFFYFQLFLFIFRNNGKMTRLGQGEDT